MIVLRQLTEPVAVDFSHIYPGFKVVLRRLTSWQWNVAQERARSVVAKIDVGLDTLSDYGLNGVDANGVRLSAYDPLDMASAGYLVGAVEVCLVGLISWEGIFLEPGVVAPINRETLALVLGDMALATALLNELTKAARLLVSEGNGLADSPNGSLAGRPIREADRATVETAPPSKRHAPRAAPGKVVSSALKSSTLPKH